MRLKCDLLFTQVGGREIAIPSNTDPALNDNVLLLNGVASFILKCLGNEISRAELLARLISNYDAKSDDIESAMCRFLEELDKLGLIADNGDCVPN